MEDFINFLVNNFLLFLLAALVLVFALIGYLVDSKKKKEGFVEPQKLEKKPEDAIDTENLKSGLDGVSFNDVMKETKTEEPKTEAVVKEEKRESKEEILEVDKPLGETITVPKKQEETTEGPAIIDEPVSETKADTNEKSNEV